jgi:hypothetical protein
MPLTWLIGYRIQEGKETDFAQYLRSDKFRHLRSALLKETGIRIRETLFAVEPSSHELGDYDAWDLWEVPDYAAIDRYVRSEARKRFITEYLIPFVGPNYKWITTRTFGDSD